MIIWDDKDPWGPEKHHRCIMCRGRLRPPLIVWHARVNDEEDDNGDDDFFGQRFICGPCAVWMCRGLSLDMRGIEKAKEIERLGFNRAAKQAAISDGFLWTGETAKQ